MHAVERVGQQRAEIDDLFESNRPATERIEQRSAFEILEDQERRAFPLLGAIDQCEIGMKDVGDCSRFTVELPARG